MKKVGFVLSAAAVVLLGACGGGAAEAGKKGDEATAGAGAVTYTVDAAKSTLEWKGSALFGLKSHNGTVAIKEGELSADGGKLTAGSVTMDMTGIKVSDLTKETGAEKLVGHFGAPDLFDIKKFPTASFSVVKIEEKAEGENTHMVTGNLTLKDSTKSITFPAKVSVTGDNVTATGKVTINRLDWGVSYDGDKQNTEKSAVEKMIKEQKGAVVDKNIDLTLNIVANKK